MAKNKNIIPRKFPDKLKLFFIILIKTTPPTDKTINPSWDDLSFSCKNIILKTATNTGINDIIRPASDEEVMLMPMDSKKKYNTGSQKDVNKTIFIFFPFKSTLIILNTFSVVIVNAANKNLKAISSIGVITSNPILENIKENPNIVEYIIAEIIGRYFLFFKNNILSF